MGISIPLSYNPTKEERVAAFSHDSMTGIKTMGVNDIEMKLFDISGSILFSQKVGNIDVVEMCLRELNIGKGIYVLVLTQDDEIIVTRKIVI